VGVGIGVWCLSMSLGMAALFAVVPYAEEALTVMAAGLLLWFATKVHARGSAWRRRAGGVAERRGRAGIPGVVPALPGGQCNESQGADHVDRDSRHLSHRGGAAGRHRAADAGACVLSLSIHAVYAALFSTRQAAALYLRAAPVINLGVGAFFTSFAVKLAAPLLARAM
jgi:threonine/homoserine/homoserine lactone efflux protein